MCRRHAFWGILGDYVFDYRAYSRVVVAFELGRVVGSPLVEAVIDAVTVKRYDYIMKHKGLFLALPLFPWWSLTRDYEFRHPRALFSGSELRGTLYSRRFEHILHSH